jgi:hypothetical protein
MTILTRLHSIFLQLLFLLTGPLHRNLITQTAISMREIDYDTLKKHGVRLIIFDL